MSNTTEHRRSTSSLLSGDPASYSFGELEIPPSRRLAYYTNISLDQQSATPLSATSRTHQAMLPSKNKVDLRLLDYVSSFDKNLMCPICHCPFINGIRLDCDHIFCHRCIDQALESQSKPINDCPSCRRTVNAEAAQRAPRAIAQMVDELQVLCPHHKEGCQQILARADVQDHVDKYCIHTEVECPAEDCHLRVLRKDASRGCLHSTVTCTDCDTDLMEKDLEV